MLPPPTSAISVSPRATLERVAQGLAHRRDRQPAFFRRADDLDLQARGQVDAIEKGVGIAGLAGGAGGDRPDLLDLVEFQELVEVAEDGQGHAHAGGAQAAAAEGVLPQAGCPLQALDDFDAAVGQDLGDDHPHGVGADVDRRDRLGPFRFVFLFGGFHGQLSTSRATRLEFLIFDRTLFFALSVTLGRVQSI